MFASINWQLLAIKAGVAFALILGAYVYGRVHASAACDAEQLRSELAAVKADLAIERKSRENETRLASEIIEEVNRLRSVADDFAKERSKLDLGNCGFDDRSIDAIMRAR